MRVLGPLALDSNLGLRNIPVHGVGFALVPWVARKIDQTQPSGDGWFVNPLTFPILATLERHAQKMANDTALVVGPDSLVFEGGRIDGLTLQGTAEFQTPGQQFLVYVFESLADALAFDRSSTQGGSIYQLGVESGAAFNTTTGAFQQQQPLRSVRNNPDNWAADKGKDRTLLGVALRNCTRLRVQVQTMNQDPTQTFTTGTGFLWLYDPSADTWYQAADPSTQLTLPVGVGSGVWDFPVGVPTGRAWCEWRSADDSAANDDLLCALKASR